MRAVGCDPEPMTPEAGPILDRLIELRVFGRKPIADVPPYSTSDSAADVVVRALARPPWRWMCVQTGSDWTFHWRRPLENRDPDTSTISRYVNLITVTAPTRPLAICLAALKYVGPIGRHHDAQAVVESDGEGSSGSSENSG
jgi:hypothetical protein